MESINTELKLKFLLMSQNHLQGCVSNQDNSKEKGKCEAFTQSQIISAFHLNFKTYFMTVFRPSLYQFTQSNLFVRVWTRHHFKIE